MAMTAEWVVLKFHGLVHAKGESPVNSYLIHRNLCPSREPVWSQPANIAVNSRLVVASLPIILLYVGIEAFASLLSQHSA